MAESKKGHSPVIISRDLLQSKSGHLILVQTCMQNTRILAQGALKLSCLQGFSIAIMVESKKGHNVVNISLNLLKS